MTTRQLLLPIASLLLAPALMAQRDGGPDRSRLTPRPTSNPSFGSVPSRIAEPGGGSMQVRPLDAFATRHNQIVHPRATPRCTVLPTDQTWRHRDLMAEIQAVARQGVIPVLPVPGDVDLLNDSTAIPSGWKAYGFTVPGNGELEVRLEHPNLGWFRLAMVNKWGQLQEGMLQNLIPKGFPVVTFKNPKREAQQVFIIADDPGWMSSKALPYKLVIKRNWDGKKEAPNTMPQVLGVWARQGSVELRPAPAKPSPDGQADKGAPHP